MFLEGRVDTRELTVDNMPGGVGSSGVGARESPVARSVREDSDSVGMMFSLPKAFEWCSM